MLSFFHPKSRRINLAPCKAPAIIKRMKKDEYQTAKRLSKERAHQKWLEQNIKNSNQNRESKKNILKLQTKLAYERQNQ